MHRAAPDSTVCHNCGAPLHGPFCSACGQEARPLDPTLRETVSEIGQELLDVDGRTIRSIRRLFLSPGFLTREQFEGRRIGWLSPIRLYLIFSVAYFAVTAFAGSNVHVRVSAQTDGETVNGLQRIGFQNEEELRLALGRAQATWMPRVMFVLVPFFAWLVQLARRRAGRTYPQHLQFALHAHAAWFGARAVAATSPLLKSEIASQALTAFSLIYGAVYVALALRVVYGGTRRAAVLQTIGLLAIYGTVLLFATLAIVLTIVRPR
jgi:hypothetical protein